MGKRNKKEKGGGGGSTPKKKYMYRSESAATRRTTENVAVTTTTMDAEPMLVDEAEAEAAVTVGTAAAATAVSASVSPKKSPGKTTKPPQPPPPAIPPPPAPPALAPPTCASTSTLATATATAKSKSQAKPSSAVMDAGGITRGLIGSPFELSAAATCTSMPTPRIGSDDDDDDDDDESRKIDISDARRRREIQQLGDSPTRGFERKKRTYEEENDGYGEQMRLATSEHVAMPVPASAGGGGDNCDGDDDDVGIGTGDNAGGVGIGEAAPPVRTSALSATGKGAAGGGIDTGTAAGGNAGNAASSSRAQAAARLQALRGSAGTTIGSNGTGPTQTKKKEKISAAPPAPPSVAPPSPPPMLSPTGSVKTKIQSLNHEIKTAHHTTAAQQRAAELANLRRKGIAKIFNRHFTAEAATIAKEKEAADKALAELERQKAELAQKHRAYKDKSDKDSGTDNSKDNSNATMELGQIDAMAAVIRRRRVEVRQKEQETKELYRRYVCQFGPEAAAASKSKSVPAVAANSAQAANNAAAAEFFRSVNTGANAGLPLLGPSRMSPSSSSSKSSHGNRRSSFGSDHNYQGQLGGAVVTPTALASGSSHRSFGIGDNLYQGQMPAVVAPGHKQRYRSSAKRVLPSVGEETDGMDIDLQSDNVVRQADLLVAKIIERKDKMEQAEVKPKRNKIDKAVSEFKRDGKEAAVPVGRDQITVGLQHHGSRLAVCGIGTDGEEITVSRSGGVLNKKHDGSADVKGSEVNYASYRERDLVPLDPRNVVGEFSKPVKGMEPINTPEGVVWKRPEHPATGTKSGAATSDNADAVPPPPFGFRPDDVTPRAGHVSSVIGSFDAALRRSLNIDPTADTFTVKIAGGPDDRAAADEIRSIIHFYGDKVKIVGITDESGCTEDPDGLDHAELLRLVDSKSSIAAFDKTKLSGGVFAAVHSVDTSEGKKAGQTMLSRVNADAFVPLSSPSSVIDLQSYQMLLKEDGTPSIKVIIEGLNACVTAEARQKLEEDAGVVVQRQLTPLVATLDVQLRTTMGINPAEEAFSVKLTGGPGDESTAQEIKVLIREYGDKVQFVAIADESGCIEDSNGLDHQELLRLVEEGKPTSQYDKTKLYEEGILHLNSTAEGIKARNSMPYRIKADIYIPAGSFSRSLIDTNNYRNFILPDGSPSSAVIIEPSGISSYVSAEARERLQNEACVKVLSPTALSPVDVSRLAPLMAESPIAARVVNADLGVDADMKTPRCRILISSPGDRDVSIMALAEGLTSPSANVPIEESHYKHLDFSVNSDSVSSLGSLGDLTQDDITVATTTLFNFLQQETENIRKMFDDSERAEKEALEGSGSSDDANFHTRQSAMSMESEEIRRATQQAELMAKHMAQATSWIDEGDENIGEKDELNEEEEIEDFSTGRLYSIHQKGDMFEFDSTIKSVRWDAYWSSEHNREYYHEPRTNTTTWTRPPGVRVDSQPPSLNPSAAPTENMSLFSDEVLVRDFTTTGEGGSITPSSVCQSVRSPGASIFSDVTYDGDKTTPKARAGNSWFWSSSRTKSTTTSIGPSADLFRPDSGLASHSLAQYRLKQKGERRRRRRRAVAAVALILLLTVAVFWLEGSVLVPIANKISGGRIAWVVLPIINNDVAMKYGLLKPIVKLPMNKKTVASNPEEKKGAVTSNTIESSARKTSPKKDTHKKEEMKSIDAVGTSQTEQMNPNNAKSTAAALNAETEKMMKRRAICFIPFSYLFYRPCWRESRSLPLDMSWLDNSMQ